MQDEKQHLYAILQAAKLAQRYLSNVTLDNFLSDTMVQDAVIRRLQIMAAMAEEIPPDSREPYPQIPWDSINAIHSYVNEEYDVIDLKEVWDTVNKDITILIQELEMILK